MNKEKFTLLTKGMIKNLPGLNKIFLKRNIKADVTSTDKSGKCYSIWLRHLQHWCSVNSELPENVAELGPGSTLGTGFAALLSGCKRIYILDVVERWDTKKNLKTFEELIELFKNKAIPENLELPTIITESENFCFPKKILTDDILEKSLLKNRLDRIKNEILNLNNPDNIYITCQVPWYDTKIIDNNVIDFIFSQSVLEHVENLDHTYSAMHKWLKPNGLMSHVIDFSSHGITKSWNGHWKFKDIEWNIIKGGKIYLLNRQPLSKHIELNSKYNFEILENKSKKKDNIFNKDQFQNKFNLSNNDITTCAAYILSQKNNI